MKFLKSLFFNLLMLACIIAAGDNVSREVLGSNIQRIEASAIAGLIIFLLVKTGRLTKNLEQLIPVIRAAALWSATLRLPPKEKGASAELGNATDALDNEVGKFLAGGGVILKPRLLELARPPKFDMPGGKRRPRK